MKHTRPAQRGAAVLACLALMGCSDVLTPAAPTETVAPPLPASSTTSPGQGASTPEPTDPTTSAPADPTTEKTESIPLTHSVKSGGLTVNIGYSASPAVARWTLDGAKTVQVSLTVVNNRRPSQKVYLSRVTVRFTAGGDPGNLPGADPVVDTANFTPGYLASFPYKYEQTFAAPTLQAGLSSLRFDFKYELVTLVDKKAKDYTKQVVTDSVSVKLPF